LDDVGMAVQSLQNLELSLHGNKHFFILRPYYFGCKFLSSFFLSARADDRMSALGCY
jgi:hypothetical protein